MDPRGSLALVFQWVRSPQVKRAAGWTAVLFGLVAVFLAVTFPYDALQARILAEVSRRIGGELHADQWEIAWPFGLNWQGVSLKTEENQRVQIDELRVTFNAASVLTGRLTADMAAWVHGGSPTGGGRVTVRVAMNSWSENTITSVAGRIEHLPLTALGVPAVRRGRLTADFTHRWEGTSPVNGTASMEGRWTIDVADVSIEQMAFGAIRLPPVTVANGRMTLDCRAAVCRIQELTGDGADGFLQGDGQITIRRPFRNSTLALSISVTPSPAFVQRAAATGLPVASAGAPLKVNISGPLSQPRIAFM